MVHVFQLILISVVLLELTDGYALRKRGASSFARVGRGASSFARVGRGASSFARVGRGASNFARVGRGASNFARVGRGASSFARVGRGASNFARVGRSGSDEQLDRMIRGFNDFQRIAGPAEVELARVGRGTPMLRQGFRTGKAENEDQDEDLVQWLERRYPEIDDISDDSSDEDDIYKRGIMRLVTRYKGSPEYSGFEPKEKEVDGSASGTSLSPGQ